MNDFYKNIVDNLEIACIWGILNGNKFEVEGKNKKYIEFFMDDTYINKKVINVMLNYDENNNYRTVYIDKYKIFYIAKVQKIKGEKFVIWYLSEIKIDEDIIESFKIQGFEVEVRNLDNSYVYSSEEKIRKTLINNGNLVLNENEKLVYSYIDKKEENIFDLFKSGKRNNLEDIYYFNNRIYNSLKYPVYKNQNLLSIIEIKKDITELYSSKDEHGFMNKMLEVLLDNIYDMVVYTDEKSKMKYCNKKVLDIFNLNREEAKFLTDDDMKHCIGKEYVELYGKLDKEALESRKKISKQIGNGYFDREVIKIPYINENDEIEGIITIVREIIGKLKEKKELEKLKMDFFSNLSHELKTPLNVIFVAVQYLEQISKNNDNILSYSYYFKIISKNCCRLLKLVNNLIDSNKLESKSLIFIPVDGDIVNFVNTMIYSANEYLEDYNIKIEFYTNSTGYPLLFDKDKMGRIITNLLSNAIKFNIGKIYISVSLTVNRNDIEIKIKDNGIGISKNEINSIFEKFKQINNRLTKISEGSSLGLSIVKAFVEMHEGTITVESEEGKGSCFCINIPKNSEEVHIPYYDYSDECREKIKMEFSDLYLER